MTDTYKISKDYNVGGSGQGSGKGATQPRLVDVIRGLASDVARAGAGSFAIASADAAVAAGATPTKAEFDVVVALVNEIKAALNASSAAVSAPLLAAGGGGPYDLSAAGALALTLTVDGQTFTFQFLSTDFANPAAATAAELTAAFNSRIDPALNVLAQDNGGTLELIGGLGDQHSLAAVAGGANAVLGFSTTAVVGSGFVASVQAV